MIESPFKLVFLGLMHYFVIKFSSNHGARLS